jgi:hypothetical protein
MRKHTRSSTEISMAVAHREENTNLFLERPSLPVQGCQMFVFKPKYPNLGKFWRVLQWKILVHFMTIWCILVLLEIFNGHLVYFVVIWYIFPRFGILYQEKSGNPDFKSSYFVHTADVFN